MQNSGSSSSSQTLLSQAEKHFQAGRLGEAETLLRTLLKSTPNNADALFALGLIAHAANKSDVAIELIEEAIEINPSAARFHTNISALYLSKGETAKAIDHGRTAVTLRPNQSEAHNNLGTAYMSAGDVQTAIEHFTKAIESNPKNTDAWSNRSGAYGTLRQFERAEKDARSAVETNPQSASAAHSLAAALMAGGGFEPAEALIRQTLVAHPGERNAMHDLVIALRGQKKFEPALAIANQTYQLFPDSDQALSLAGSVHLELNNLTKAGQLINQALALDPDRLETVLLYAQLQLEELRTEKALETLRRAIALKPSHPDCYNLLGKALRESGQFDEAVKAFERCVALDPSNFGAFVNLAESKTFVSLDDPHLTSMERARAGAAALSDDQEMMLNFALGKAYDDVKAFDSAFTSFNRACAIKRKTLLYSESETLQLFERIQRAFTPSLVQRFAGKGIASTLPIFILGMPRSGTTMIEQIVSSHPMVKGAGEVRDVHDALGDMRQRTSERRAYPELLHHLTDDDITFFAQSVIRRLDQHWPGSLRITNKMTSNYFFLGLLHLALPNAKIIHTMRNPVDTCVSCYSKLFSAEVNYSYDLGELGRYYSAYHGLMEFWRTALPRGAFLDVQYEEVIGDLEGQARKVIDYCGLEWDPGVLDFHRNERTVKTASAVQVRQPLYSSSVARWRNYEQHLGPLLKELGPLVH